MADPFYTLRFTDVTKGSFVVNPNTTNGPAAPDTASLATTPSAAVSANTTLLLLGRGSFDYGQPVQQNLVYLLENFADTTAPSYPIEGQLWFKNDNKSLFIYDGAAWQPLVVSGGFTADLDMNGFKIIDLGAATSAGDAVSMGFADARYVNQAGDTMTGTLTMSGAGVQVVLPNVPVGGTDATNKTYVDTTITTQVAAQVAVAVAAATAGYPAQFVDVVGDTMTGTLTLSTGSVVIQTGGLQVDLGNISLPIGSFSMVAGNISMTNGHLLMQNGSITNAAGNITLTAGNLSVGGTSTFTGLSTFNGPAQHNTTVTITDSSLTMAGTASLINMSTNRIINLGLPLVGTDAASKDYVDAAVGGGGGDGVVYAGTVDGVSGVITLNRTLGLPDVILAGAAAPFTHTHISTSVFHNTDPAYSNSYARTQTVGLGTFPTAITLNEVIGLLDEYIGTRDRPFYRQLFTSDGVQVAYTLLEDYLVAYNQVQVYVDGVKWIASANAQATVDVSPAVTIASVTGLANSTSYAFNLTVDGVLYTNVTITTPASGAIRYYELVNLIDAQLVTLTIPAVCVFVGLVTIASTSAGAGSSVTIAAPSAGTNLWTSITGTATISNDSVTSDYGYEETGTPFQPTDTVTLNSAPIIGSTIEFLILT